MPADFVRSVADYRTVADDYDRATRPINAVRLDAIAALELREGDTVLDACCGSGYCFPSILAGVGPSGQLIAFDRSPRLLAIARARGNHRNLTVMESGAESVVLPKAPTAILFSYAHDALQSNEALNNLLDQAEPGARIALCGGVAWPFWAFPVNLWLRSRHRDCITNFENFDAPWRKIEPRLRAFRVERRGPGWRYLASGVLA